MDWAQLAVVIGLLLVGAAVAGYIGYLVAKAKNVKISALEALLKASREAREEEHAGSQSLVEGERRLADADIGGLLGSPNSPGGQPLPSWTDPNPGTNQGDPAPDGLDLGA